MGILDMFSKSNALALRISNTFYFAAVKRNSDEKDEQILRDTKFISGPGIVEDFTSEPPVLNENQSCYGTEDTPHLRVPKPADGKPCSECNGTVWVNGFCGVSQDIKEVLDFARHNLENYKEIGKFLFAQAVGTLPPGWEEAVDENGDAIYHYYETEDGNPVPVSELPEEAAAKKLLLKTTTPDRPIKPCKSEEERCKNGILQDGTMCPVCGYSERPVLKGYARITGKLKEKYWNNASQLTDAWGCTISSPDYAEHARRIANILKWTKGTCRFKAKDGTEYDIGIAKLKLKMSSVILNYNPQNPKKQVQYLDGKIIFWVYDHHKQEAGLIELIALLTDMKNRKDELHKIYDKVRLIGPSVEYFLLEAAKRYVQANKVKRRSSTVSTRTFRRSVSSISPPEITSAMEKAAMRRNEMKPSNKRDIYDTAVYDYEGTSGRRRLSPEEGVIARRRLTSPRRDSPVLMKLLEQTRKANQA